MQQDNDSKHYARIYQGKEVDGFRLAKSISRLKLSMQFTS